MLPDAPHPTPPLGTAAGRTQGALGGAVDLLLPASPASVGAQAAPQPTHSQTGGLLAAAVYENTLPFGLPVAAAVPCRVLVISADPEERVLLRACLALARLVWVDEASTSTQARVALAEQAHALVFINLDFPVVDAGKLVQEVALLHPQTLVLATTARPAVPAIGGWPVWRALAYWWQRRLAKQAGFTDLLHKPLRSGLVAVWAGLALKKNQKYNSYKANKIKR